jgi:hypothetical protein
MPFTMTVRPPFTFPDTTPLMIVALASAFVQARPRGQLLGLVARELGGAEAVFQRFDGHGHEIAGFHFDFTPVVLEFFGCDGAFGLKPRVHDHDVGVYRDDLGGDHFTDAHFLARKALFEERGKAVFERGGGLG